MPKHYKKGLTPLALARRLSANLHAVREHTPPKAPYGVHHAYRKNSPQVNATKATYTNGTTTTTE